MSDGLQSRIILILCVKYLDFSWIMVLILSTFEIFAETLSLNSPRGQV